MLVGTADLDGVMDGDDDGSAVGPVDALIVGDGDGRTEGSNDGAIEGESVGVFVGLGDGLADGPVDGAMVGSDEGITPLSVKVIVSCCPNLPSELWMTRSSNQS